jgi:hypothetical protein
MAKAKSTPPLRCDTASSSAVAASCTEATHSATMPASATDSSRAGLRTLAACQTQNRPSSSALYHIVCA